MFNGNLIKQRYLNITNLNKQYICYLRKQHIS